MSQKILLGRASSIQITTLTLAVVTIFALAVAEVAGTRSLKSVWDFSDQTPGVGVNNPPPITYGVANGNADFFGVSDGQMLSVVSIGNYPSSTVELSGNTTVIPDSTPSGVTYISVTTNSSFKGRLEGDPITGVVHVTDAHPAGTYLVTVSANGPGGAAVRTFSLTANLTPACQNVTFAHRSFPRGIGVNSSELAIGDFNRDGKQDIAVPNSNSHDVSILVGDGSGSFVSPVNFAVESQPRALAIGDFNGDGIEDIAVANSETNTISILTGIGPVQFAPAVSLPGGTYPHSIAVGDFNRDRKQDLAITNDHVSILVGDGNGGFSSPISFDTESYPTTIAVGDFNGDGNEDLVTAHAVGDRASILIGDGNNGFATPVTYGVGSYPNSVAIGDFNGDGNQDLAVANLNSRFVSILIGNGGGQFVAGANVFGTFSSWFLSVGDFNGDGNQDIADADNGDHITIFIGDGNGGFAAVGDFPVGQSPSSVAVGDFNMDGRQDLVSANSYEIGVLLRTCPPTPTATATGSPSATITSTPTATPSAIPSATVGSPTATTTSTPTATATAIPSATISGSPTATTTSTPLPTFTGTPTVSPTATPISNLWGFTSITGSGGFGDSPNSIAQSHGVIMVACCGKVFRSTDFAQTWQDVTPQGYFSFYPSVTAFGGFNSPLHFFVTDSDGFWVTYDGGESWSAAKNPPPGIVFPVDIIALSVDEVETVFISTDNEPRVFYTQDGNTWTPFDFGLPRQVTLDQCDDFAITDTTFASSQYLFVNCNGTIYRSLGIGSGWTAASAGLPANKVASISPAHGASIVYAVVDDDACPVYLSPDNGLSWQPACNNVNGAWGGGVLGVVTDLFDPNIAYAINASTAFKTTDAGQTWVSYGMGLSDAVLEALAIDYGGPASPRPTLYAFGGRSSPIFSTGVWTLHDYPGTGCNFQRSPSSPALINKNRATYPVAVTTQDGCYWRLASNSTWITSSTYNQDGDGNIGSGIFLYDVEENTSSAPRSGSLTIATTPYQIDQTNTTDETCNLLSGAIGYGTNLGGLLSNDDCIGSYTYYDRYRFNGVAGDRIAIEMNSAQFDTVLELYDPQGGLAGFNDDIMYPSNTNSRIPTPGDYLTLESSGAYTIRARSSFFSTFRIGLGDYTIRLLADGFTQTPTVTPTATGTNTPAPTYTPTNTPTATPTITPDPSGHADFDYDGDGKTDISIFRPNGAWYLQRSRDGLYGAEFGFGSDKITPADYDGDGKDDIAVYRPSDGIWYIFQTSTGTVDYRVFGLAEDLPTPADYDGDGRADISVFRPSTATWYRQNSSNGTFYAQQFGQTGDKPTIGDFDGDNHADLAIFRPSLGDWYQLYSSDDSVHGARFGFGTDVIVSADWDGDGRTDIAVYRPTNGVWYLTHSSDGSFDYKVFGLSTDIPAPGDFDGDGTADISVFRPSDGIWYRQNSSDGSFVAYPFGTNGDKPTETAFRY